MSTSQRGRLYNILFHIVETVLLKLFFWETEPARIGKLIRFLHHGVLYILGALLVFNHVVYQNYLLFLVLYICCSIIWIQHIVTWDCLVSSIEAKFIGDSVGFLDPILEAMHIPVTKETSTGVMILGSTLVITMLTLELISRTSLAIQGYFRR